MNGANSLGQTQTTHWYATDQSTYNQLVKVFEAYMDTRVRLAALNATLNLLPVDSDPGTAGSQVQGERINLSILQANWNGVEESSSSMRCSVLQSFLIFYNEKENFIVPDASQSTLATQITQVQTQWSSAQVIKQPTLPEGMTTPWKLTQQQVTSQLASSEMALTNLKKANTLAQTQLDTLKMEYTALSTKVNTLKKTCSIA